MTDARECVLDVRDKSQILKIIVYVEFSDAAVFLQLVLKILGVLKPSVSPRAQPLCFSL